ncbi:MAG: hypothetical protein AAFP78_07050, partial [Pseudomonadota bacterium]
MREDERENGLAGELKRDPLVLAANVFSAIAAVAGFLTTVFGLLTGSFEDAKDNVVLVFLGKAIDEIPFLIAALVLIGGAMGWMVGLVGHLLSMAKQEIRLLVGHLMAVTMAAALIGCVELLISENEKFLPIRDLSAVIAVSVALLAARKQMRRTPSRSLSRAAERSQTMLTFAASAVAIFLLSSLSKD